MKHRAFTLIEVLIVVIITSLLSVGLAVSFSGARAQAEFKQDVANITNIVQKARASSLTNVLLDTGEPVAFYELNIAEDSISLWAYDTDDYPEELASETFSDSVSIDSEESVFYFPPYGEVCFRLDSLDECDFSSGITSKTLVLSSTANESLSKDITISIYSGYAEVTDS